MFRPVRLARYGKAAAHWIAAGRPVRTDVEVQRVFETFCRPCEHYDTAAQRCRLCGCRVAPSGPALRNKLKMGTQRCADIPPLWIEEVNPS